MARSGGYGSYRGRSPLRTFLKTLILLLTAVLVLGVVALVFLQQYIVYSSDGIRLELPFFATPAPAAEQTGTPPPESQPPVVETPQIIEPDWLKAVALSRSALYDDSAADLVDAAGGNAALFDMKADDGSLGYVSGLDLAVSAKVSSGDAAINAAIRALNAQEGMYTVARVSCFKDDALARSAEKAMVVTTNSGYRWTDPEGLRWLSPTSEAARQYVTDVCVELAGLGFDEIVLDNSGYPTQGNLNYIKKGDAYDKETFAAVVTGFYAQVAQALEGYDVKLSVLTDGQTVTDGSSEVSGQTLTALTAYADRIWLREPTAQAQAALLEAGVAEENVINVTSGPADESAGWALTAAETGG